MEIIPGIFPVKLKIPLISTTIAIISGLVVLLLYFSPLELAGVDLRTVLLQWAGSLGAVALLLGLFNLASVHGKKLDGDGGAPVYSGVLLLAMLVTFGLVLVLGPASTGANFVVNYIQVPIEGSLIALLAITLVYASARLVRRRTDLFSLIFMGTALLFLLMISPLVTDLFPVFGEQINGFRNWVTEIFATSGARGILLGIALGTIATGLRILMGADRPYGG